MLGTKNGTSSTGFLPEKSSRHFVAGGYVRFRAWQS